MASLSINVGLKRLIYVLLMAFMVFGTACSKKDSKSGDARRYRNDNWQRGFEGSSGQVSGGWGVITNTTDFNNIRDSVDGILDQFMVGINDLGDVEGGANDPTGINFRGEVNTRNQNGQIYILIWDSVAAQTGKAYYWPVTVRKVDMDNSGASVLAEDDAGLVLFDGNFSGNMWTGTVSFENTKNSARGTLGQFQIYIDSILF